VEWKWWRVEGGRGKGIKFNFGERWD